MDPFPLGFTSHGDDDFSSSVSLFEIADSLRDLTQRVSSVAARSASDETDSDAALKIEEVKAGRPIRVGEITLVPIEHTLVSYAGMERVAMVRGSKGLAGIVVVSGKNRYAIDLTGEEVAMNRYLTQVPELARRLDRL